MKKIKLLTPILSAITLTGTLVPLTACKNSSKEETKENVELDTTTSTPEQETTANVTTATYTFNVNNCSDEEEVIPEIVDESTEDDVTVEIIEYKLENGKLTVVVAISKKDGTLNDQEEVSFSINFKCENKQTKTEKWSKKIEHLKVKHHFDPDEDVYIDDTDTEKEWNAEEKAAEQTAEFAFLVNTDEEFDISKLSVVAFQGKRSLLTNIKITETASVAASAIDGYIKVCVTYDSSTAKQLDVASFGLLFTYNYNEQTESADWVQTIDGFSIVYGAEVTSHIGLYSSRERHFYKNASKTGENSNNYICLMIEDGKTYQASDLEISITENKKVELVPNSTQIFTIPLPHSGSIQEIAFAYTLKETKSANFFEPDKDLQNVAVTVKSNQVDNNWEQTIKGFTFQNWGTKDGSLISYDTNKMSEIELSAKEDTTTDLVNVFTTISPIDTADIIRASIQYPGAAENEIKTQELDVQRFSYYETLRDPEHVKTKIVVPALTDAEVGEDKEVTYTFLLHTLTACYYYELTTKTKIVAE